MQSYISDRKELERAIQQMEEMIKSSPQDARESLERTLEILKSHRDYVTN